VLQQLLSGLLPFGFHVAAKNRLAPKDVAVRHNIENVNAFFFRSLCLMFTNVHRSS
jgi:hypothetical protein